MTTKKYLTTPEEILALKDTDTKIYAEGSKGYYQFVNGILCYFYSDGSILMFSEIGIGKGYLKRYILVEEPVKEADKNDIGKLCWFFDDDGEDEDYKTLSTLKSIDNNKYVTIKGYYYRHCRRLSPSEVAEITGYKVEEK